MGRKSIDLNRRSLLKSLGSAALAPAYATTASAKGVPTKEVPKIISSEGIVETREVPRPWANHFERVKRVRDAFENTYLEKNGVTSVGIGSIAGEEHGGWPGLGIVARVANHRAAERVPDVAEGVSVRVEEETEEEPFLYNFEDYSNIPGGAAVNDPALNSCDDIEPGETNLGTAGWVQDGMMITAAHTFDSLSSEVFQHSQRMGEGTDGDTTEDWMAIDPDWDVSLDDSIINEDSLRVPVEGVFSEWELGIYVAYTSADAYKSGITTGTTSGTIEEMRTTRYGGHGIRASMVGANGDSGGPIFAYDGETATIAGMLAAGLDPDMLVDTCAGYVAGADEIVGPAGYRILEQL